MYADHIVVLENGLTVETGTHESLMNHAGKYHDMVVAQAAFAATPTDNRPPA